MCSVSMHGPSIRWDKVPAPKPVRGGGAKSSALRSGDIARPMQAGSVTPKSPAWVNEVMTKPSVQPR